MTSVTTTVKRLIALATDPGAAAGEAANAAIAACRLLRRHIELLGSAPTPTPSPAAPGPDRVRRMRIMSRYDGRCRACGLGYAAGADIWWARGAGGVHIGCDREAA